MEPRSARLPSATGASTRGSRALVALLAALLVVGLAFAAVGAQQASAASGSTIANQLLKEYQANGKINPCKHSAADLQKAKKAIGANVEAYSPDFGDALDSAIAKRGSCPSDQQRRQSTQQQAAPAPSTGGSASGGGSQGAAPVTTTSTQQAAPTTTRAAPATPGPGPVEVASPQAQQGAPIVNVAAARGGDGPSTAAWAVVGGGLLLLAALAWSLVTLAGRRSGPLTPLGHAVGEAGWRIGNRWSEFADWLRIGGR